MPAEARFSLTNVVILGALLKLLLFPAYLSTDFDVHRNWLAITHNLPLSEWYHEATSQWTLDYPPFFAYFEYILSQFVPRSAVADGCLRIVAEDGLYGWPTIKFQRATVLVSELALAASLRGLDSVVASLLWFHPGWLILDHIHFQYNAAMFGLLIMSLRAMQQQRFLKSALQFATLLCFKHIYLYVAPAYAVFLLKHYIFAKPRSATSFVVKGAKLGVVTLLPFLLAFGPVFAADPDGLTPVLGRLFPFSRGLTHAYWAPNFWALYSAVDRGVAIFKHNQLESATRGIVGQIAFSNLPEITPRLTFLITVSLQVVSTLSVGPASFLESVTLCGFASFLFGWHVHEKAVLVAVVPFALVATKSVRHTQAFWPLLVSSVYSLFPLIYTPGETILKTTYSLGFLAVCAVVLKPAFSGKVGAINAAYTVVFTVLVLPLSSLVPVIVPKYEFAGLMLISVYAAGGIIWSWLQLLVIYGRSN